MKKLLFIFLLLGFACITNRINPSVDLPLPPVCGEFAHTEEDVCVCNSKQLFMNADGDCECRSFVLTLDDAIQSVWDGTNCVSASLVEDYFLGCQ